MLHLLLLSGLLPWGACGPRETPSNGELPLESAVVTLNGSCREQGLQRVGATVLQMLRLDRPPPDCCQHKSSAPSLGEGGHGVPSLVQQGAAPHSRLQITFPCFPPNTDISSNETLLIRRGSCTQVSHHITLEDLDWGTWVLHPNSFIFTECLGCHCHRKEEGPPPPLWLRECGLGQPSDPPGSGDPEQQGRCCRPGRTPLSFVFLDEDGSLVLRVVRLDHNCHCRP
ncbi:hypothetical protein lerEdw1_007261 [Lerista edwardsae]|nr:hypothetical protein lerEdw1_007261 [Lerista edwardsae]